MGQAQGKEFPYSADNKLQSPQGTELYSYHSGKCSKDGSSVGIFCYDNSRNVILASDRVQNSVKRTKTMRHPNMLRFIDATSYGDQELMVTEEAVPLSSMIDEMIKYPQWVAWGLQQIAAALDFLHNQCKMVHGNIRQESIFITPSGEWKLSGFEFLSPIGTDNFIVQHKSSMSSLLPSPCPPEMELKSWKGPDIHFDNYQFGVLIYSIFNGTPSKDISSSPPGAIPKQLVGSYQKLLEKSPKSRISLSKVISGPFFKNNLSLVCEFIENISLKDNNEKDIFFQKLPTQLDSIPESICKYKILPALMNALDFGSANSKVLGSILKIGKQLTPEEYVEMVAPNVAKWFSSTDKSLKINLLQNMSSFSEYLTPELINEKVFPSVAMGFLDQNPAIRELTIISIVHLAPKLNKNCIDNILLKALAKMQVDPEPGIRANATICLSKISSHLSPEAQKKTLIPAFSRALQDPFVHTRVAGVMAFASTQQYFEKEEIAKRIVPVLSCCCIDPQEKVRKASLNTIKGFIGRLEFISENPDMEENSKKNSGMFGWAVSSITSKFYPSTSTASSSVTKSKESNTTSKGPSKNDEIEHEIEEDEEFHDIEDHPVVNTTPNEWDEEWDSDNNEKDDGEWESTGTTNADGWGDMDDNWDDEPVKPVVKKSLGVKKVVESKKPIKKVVEPKKVEVESTSTWDSWDNEQNGWEEQDDLDIPQAEEIDNGWDNKETNNTIAADADGWGDMDDDWDDFTVDETKNTTSKLEAAKMKREKKKGGKSD